jgi:hypothetical protein
MRSPSRSINFDETTRLLAHIPLYCGAGLALVHPGTQDGLTAAKVPYAVQMVIIGRFDT